MSYSHDRKVGSGPARPGAAQANHTPGKSTLVQQTHAAAPPVDVQEPVALDHDEGEEAEDQETAEPEAREELSEQADETAHATPGESKPAASKPAESKPAAQAGGHRDELPVDASTRGPLPHGSYLEKIFGRPFGGVKAHTGANLSSLGAQAAAKDDTVAFEDKNPSRELVAHEMTHVVQQQKAGGASAGGIAAADSGAEREAEANEAKVAAGGAPALGATAAPAGAIHLKRKPHAPYAPTDAYNKKQKSGRPMVALPSGQQQFSVGQPTQRYTFIGGAGGQVTPFDVFDPSQSTDPRNKILTVNIAQPRKLMLPGATAETLCVLGRTRLGGSAWIAVSALTTMSGAPVNDTKLGNAAKKAAGKAVGAQPKGKLREMVFKASTKETNLALTPSKDIHVQNRAQYDHYLHRTTDQVQDGFYNVTMALPQPGKVPTAVDVARPTDRFFVMRTEVRAVPTYKTGGDRHFVSSPHWAFGCLGKLDANGEWKPDRSRRGWVPLQALHDV